MSFQHGTCSWVTEWAEVPSVRLLKAMYYGTVGIQGYLLISMYYTEFTCVQIQWNYHNHSYRNGTTLQKAWKIQSTHLVLFNTLTNKVTPNAHPLFIKYIYFSTVSYSFRIPISHTPIAKDSPFLPPVWPTNLVIDIVSLAPSISFLEYWNSNLELLQYRVPLTEKC